MKAMILAAGLGTRLRPITNDKPKALVEFNGKPLLAITLDKLIASGFDEIIVNVHHFAEQIIDFIKQYKGSAHIEVSDESDLLLDTGGGLKKAAWFFNDDKPFLVHNVDIVSEIDLNGLYQAHLLNNDALATLAVNERNSSRLFYINKENDIIGWHNNKTGETCMAKNKQESIQHVSFCCIHVINPSIFPLITETGVFSIIDVYLRLAAEYRITTVDTINALWFDIGTQERLKRAEKAMSILS